jgi:hypothetical protein
MFVSIAHLVLDVFRSVRIVEGVECLHRVQVTWTGTSYHQSSAGNGEYSYLYCSCIGLLVAKQRTCFLPMNPAAVV